MYLAEVNPQDLLAEAWRTIENLISPVCEVISANTDFDEVVTAMLISAITPTTTPNGGPDLLTAVEFDHLLDRLAASKSAEDVGGRIAPEADDGDIADDFDALLDAHGHD